MTLVAEEDDIVLEQTLLIAAIVWPGKSPDSLTLLISAPTRGARLTTSASGMSLLIKTVSLMVAFSRAADTSANKTRNSFRNPWVEVNGTPMLHNALHQLSDLGTREAIIVIEYREEAIKHEDVDIEYVHNPGSAHSLWLARNTMLAGDTVFFDGEVFWPKPTCIIHTAGDKGTHSVLFPRPPKCSPEPSVLDRSRKWQKTSSRKLPYLPCD
ncbi:hypothetical protein [Bradyrhizobium sp. B120]|uniref:hypothetical protein n=1 Tax=Bradyrhizobium sp. B120 TaxID=3410088 RepID=UPI003B981FFD